MTTHLDQHAHSLGEGVAVAAGKTAPPVVVSALSVYGVPLNQWVLIATLIYTVLMIIHTALKIYAQLKSKQ